MRVLIDEHEHCRRMAQARSQLLVVLDQMTPAAFFRRTRELERELVRVAPNPALALEVRRRFAGDRLLCVARRQLVWRHVERAWWRVERLGFSNVADWHNTLFQLTGWAAEAGIVPDQITTALEQFERDAEHQPEDARRAAVEFVRSQRELLGLDTHTHRD